MAAKRILVLIDFKVASLNTLKLALETDPAERIEAVLMYPEALSDSITDLLFYNPAAQLRKLIGTEFQEALAILHSRHESRLSPPIFKLFHGRNYFSLANFLEANGVEAIYIPKTYRLRFGRVIDPIPWLRKAGLPLFEMDWKDSPRNSEMEDLTSFFT